MKITHFYDVTQILHKTKALILQGFKAIKQCPPGTSKGSDRTSLNQLKSASNPLVSKV